MSDNGYRTALSNSGQPYQSTLTLPVPKRFRSRMRHAKSMNQLKDERVEYRPSSPVPSLKRHLSRSWSPLPFRKHSKGLEDPTVAPTRIVSDSVSISSSEVSEQAPIDDDFRSQDPQQHPANLRKRKGRRGSSAKIEKVATKLWSASVKLLSPDFKTRKEEFAKYFDLPETEEYLVDYSCALQKDILIHGRMYLSPNYICFYANILGVKTNIAVNWNDITMITKERTARLIPNAIQVTTKGDEKLFFSSLTHREKVYDTVTMIWKSCLANEQVCPNDVSDDSSDTEELSQYDDHPIETTINDGETAGIDDRTEQGVEKHEDFKDGCRVIPNMSARQSLTEPVLHYHSNDQAELRDYPHVPPATAKVILSPRSSVPAVAFTFDSFEHNSPTAESAEEATTVGAAVLNGVVNQEIGTVEENQPVEAKDHHGTAIENDGGPTSNTPSLIPADRKRSRSPSPESEDDGNCRCQSHQGKEMTNVILPLSVDQVFLFLFSDCTFYQEMAKNRGLEKIEMEDWSKDNESGSQVRKLHYTLNLTNPFGPKQTTTDEIQTMDEKSRPGRRYTVYTEVTSHDVPYADTFYILNTYCISRISANKCRLMTNGAVMYRKSCWGVVKSFIEKNTYNGLHEYFDFVTAKLNDECHKMGMHDNKGKERCHPGARSGGRRSTVAQASRPAERLQTLPESTNERQQAPQLQHDTAAKTESLGRILLVIVISLILGNCYLFYTLRNLNRQLNSNAEVDEWRDTPHVWRYKSLLQDSGLSKGDWLKIVRKQEQLHMTDITTWSAIAENAVSSLEQIEVLLRAIKSEIEYAQLTAQIFGNPEPEAHSIPSKAAGHQKSYIEKLRVPNGEEIL